MVTRRTRLFACAVLALAAEGLALASGCSSILGIGDLPIDAGGDGARDARSDRAGDQSSPDSGGCTPSCSGDTPVCLDHACVACKPSTVRCSAAGAPQQCNSGGTWVPSPACGASTPYCLEGECVQCLPSSYVASCLPEAGGLEYCSDAGVVSTNACPCANAECQAFPTGAMGACHYDAGSYTRYDPGTTLDCTTLLIDDNATVAFAPAADGGALDAAGVWTVIGVVGDAVINGTLVSQIDSLGTDMTVKANVPAGDGGHKEDISFTLVQAEGGAGGSSGWTCNADFADGGLAAFGNGGGGGGGTQANASGEMNAGPASCATVCSSSAPGAPGHHAGRWIGGTGGASPAGAQDAGGEGGTVFGQAGASGNGTPGSGGGGGSRGRHGGLVYMRVLGSISGEGGVDLTGQGGGPGGQGTSFLVSGGGPSCGGLPFEIQNVIGGGSGGGGAGGAGGAFILRCPNDASAFLVRVDVSGGNGGVQPFAGGNGDQQPGANGPAGIVEAGPVPP